MSPIRRLKLGALFMGVALSTTPALARTSRGAPTRPQGAMVQDLFIAVGRGDLAGVQSLLARGADPNARNALEMTPLLIASSSGQVPVVEALLHAGARLDAPTIFGTPLTFAAMGDSIPVVKLLLARGADANPQRPDGITPLMLAARGGDLEIVRELLSRKARVNTADTDGATALTYAVREGKEAVGRLLLSSGAAVDAADSRRWTPLMYAAVNGHADCVRLLLEKGARTDAREENGRTALLLAATYGGDPAVLRALVEGGADLRATDAKQHTALALATARGYAESAAFLQARGAEMPRSVNHGTPRSSEQAVHASLTALQRSMRTFTQMTGCVSCHHEGLGRMATGAARERGLAIDAAEAAAQAKRLTGALTELQPLHDKALQDPSAMKNVPLIEIGEVTAAYTWMLAGMAAHRQAPRPAAAAAAMILARQQLPDGHWQFILPRVPMQSSFFAMTALAIQAMQTYAPRARAAEVAERVRRARSWLLSAPAQTTDDLAFRLLGLKWAGASQEDSRKAINELRAARRPDGGWAQIASLPSDAYATGQALYALCVAGNMPVTDPVYQEGAQFLLRTQEEDGSWFVNKRATPVNNYFHSAFPHGESQYASFNGTCWATMALLRAVPPAHTGEVAAR